MVTMGIKLSDFAKRTGACEWDGRVGQGEPKLSLEECLEGLIGKSVVGALSVTQGEGNAGDGGHDRGEEGCSLGGGFRAVSETNGRRLTKR